MIDTFLLIKPYHNTNPLWDQCPYDTADKCPYDAVDKCPYNAGEKCPHDTIYIINIVLAGGKPTSTEYSVIYLGGIFSGALIHWERDLYTGF